MINRIDLSCVLRESVSHSYTSLVTRPTGVAVRTNIEQQLRQMGARTITVIDFSNVTLIDLSCADEIVAKLLTRYMEDGTTFVFTGLTDMQVEVIDAVLERQNMALFPYEGRDWSIGGGGGGGGSGSGANGGSPCVGFVAAPLSA